ncbi:MAG: amidohydrolase [bacterium]
MYQLLVVCAVIGFLSADVAGGGSNSPTSADLILTGGRVFTLAETEPSPPPTAVAMAGDRIVFVGDDAGALALRDETSEVRDLAGAVVIPGFCDGHAHLYSLGKALAEVDLVGTSSAEEVVSRARTAAAAMPPGIWLEGRGWDQNDWPQSEFPDRELLDAAVGDRPVLLRRVDGHAAWANSEALRLAGVDAGTADPDGGRIVRRSDGEPTGILVDNAIDLVRDLIPAVAPEEIRRRVGLAVAHCHRYGITGMHDAGAPNDRLDLFVELAEADELGLRLYCMLNDKPETLAAWLPRGIYVSDDGMLTIRAVKLFADGALGSRGALLLDSYSDEPGNSGLLVTSREQLLDLCRQAGEAGYQVCTHAIGDGGNQVTLDVYEAVLTEQQLDETRWRVEHAQILQPSDIPRFAGLGVIASVQPVHCTSDMDWAEQRVGPERIAGAYAWRSLLDSGAVLSFGTDAPVEHVNPLHGLYSARTRTHHDGSPAGGWFPEQCLTGREALRLYTTGPAYAAFQEQELGQVRAGYLADLTVLDGDPVACPPEELLQMQVLLTVVGGKVRYDGCLRTGTMNYVPDEVDPRTVRRADYE